MRKVMIVLVCIGVLVAWQICESDLAVAGHKSKKCNIAGVWKATTVGPQGESEAWIIFTPLDPAGKKFAGKAGDIDYFDATFGDETGFFPEDTEVEEGFGYAEKSSRGVYEASFTYYARSNEEKRNVWKFVDRSEIKLVDCDNALMRASVEFSLYSVDNGWIPLECVTYAGTGLCHPKK